MNANTTLCIVASILLAVASAVEAQDSATLKQEELDQLVAPIALYPDSLVSQILMASTYPLEVVQADRWVKGNGGLKGDALTDALEKESWDPSVKSLVNFPQVLAMMNDKLDWTTKLGDAFLSQQQEVMAAIQRLRAKAHAEGNLETTEEQTIVVSEEGDTQVIVIQPSEPEVVYVPTYNPSVVYGTWPYPAYPPYSYYPPGYVAGTAAVAFGAGLACGAAWGYAWGDCDWHHGDVDIDVDRNAFVNNRIDRSRYRSEIGSRNRNLQNGRGSWQHDPAHRQGAAYRDARTAERFGGTASRDAVRARDSFRGRAEAGRQDLARGDADRFRGGASPGGATRDLGGRSGGVDRGRPADRSGSRGQDRRATSDRGRQAQTSRGGAFDGANQGSRARSQSQRGQASRSGASRSGGRSSASRGGGFGGGGGRRGGGGGGRGGRR